MIVTGEPLGSYHLRPLYEEMSRSEAEFWHLLPYPESTQGEPYINTTADITILNEARRMIVIGGGFSSWTRGMADYAERRGIEVYLTELAYGSCEPIDGRVSLSKISAMSRSGAEVLSGYLGVNVEEIRITGNPLSEKLGSYKPEIGRALVLSTVEFERRDPSRLIKGVVEFLKSEGLEVVVRPHPRESLSLWFGEEMDRNPYPEEASRAEYIIGYPGTVFPVLSVLGAKVISLVPNKEMETCLPINLHSSLGVKVENIKEFREVYRRVGPMEIRDLDYLVGPYKSASSNIIDFWSK